MKILDFLPLILICLTAVYCVALGMIALIKPETAARFLLGFANSMFLHYTELLLRLAIGFAFVLRSPNMLLTDIFHWFGWILIGTTACLFLVPWQSHRKFTLYVVPHANRFLKLIGVTSLIAGFAIFFSTFH